MEMNVTFSGIIQEHKQNDTLPWKDIPFTALSNVCDDLPGDSLTILDDNQEASLHIGQPHISLLLLLLLLLQAG